ncbi:hypothetical protein [Marinobacter sp. JSM 1782161]|uniref:hypothetical protein n=1 Tax=Marinobacter sp. JSM 1782161 TaxID=2685906 RepID=UPI001401F3F4|nr:hypothetical protein [Marinobacter sp. JSM 1782161]
MSVQSEINQLMAQAIDMHDTRRASVFVNYFGFVNWLEVYVHPADQVYGAQQERETLLSERVDLDEEGAESAIEKIRQRIEQLALPFPDVSEVGPE